MIPLGGVGEIGKNMMAVAHGGEFIVLDAGLMFPDEQMLGVDLVIPDIAWLVANRENVRGIFLTHGHEDHIGGLPYVLRDVQAPVYATKLTLGLVRRKLEEHRISDHWLNEVQAGDRIKLGGFDVEFIQVAHSIPDACSLAVRTKAGILVHTSDFKLDPLPVDGRHTNVGRFAELGTEGVLALTSDSTNIEHAGYTQSESILTATFDRIFSQTTGRIIAASFASNIHRIQQIADLTIKHGRQLAVLGRSMEQNVRTARELGYLTIPDWGIIGIDEAETRPPHEVTVMTTGSQGEPLAVLARLSTDDHRKLKIKEGDTVIISAKPIPGNENLVQRVINNLFRRGAHVIYDDLEPVHVSGHANREELRLMLNLVKPQYVVPVHGEYRHLVKYGEMAVESGYRGADVFHTEVGDVLELTRESARVIGRVPQSGNVLVDGLGVGDVGDLALRDRSHLASDGVLVVVASVDQHTGQILAGPDIFARGVMDDEEEFISEAREVVAERFAAISPAAATDISTAKAEIRSALSKFVNTRTRRRPVIIPIVMEV
ncbi:MAG: ribonuclease J [Armatimonadota bacterium]